MSWRFLRALSCPARIIAAVSPLVPLVPLTAGFVALVAGVLVLRTYGPNYRVGRLLASTPEVSVAEARELAGGPPRYVRISGRIDAEDEFEDDAHRPLVFRRTRLQVRRDGGVGRPSRMAGSASSSRSATASTGIVVDDAALDSGLVVVPRESVGTAADVADRVPPARRPMTPVRLRIEQVSSIEHAIVLGVPGLGETGQPRLSAGLGRPLVLTTLEPDEAMRLLTDGEARRPLVAAACLAAGLGLVVVGGIAAVIGAVRDTRLARLERCGTVATAVVAWLVCASAALAASPSPEPIGGDPRSSGQGPGLVGDPLFALLAVVAIGVGRRSRRSSTCG